MHELGVVFHIMDSLEKVAAENEVEGISKVVLELGEVSTVIESYLQNCWKWAAKKRELFSEAELVVEILPAVTYCEGPSSAALFLSTLTLCSKLSAMEMSFALVFGKILLLLP